MSRHEIEELLRLKGWSKTMLAAELEVVETTVHTWLTGRRVVRGPAKILMRLWLAEAKPHKGNGKRAKAGAR